MERRVIKNKNIFLVYLWSFLTFGIYSLVWTVKSKRDLNALGAQIPTSWLLIIPLANIFWLYKYAEGYSHVAKKDSAAMNFVIFFFLGFLAPFIVQSEINKHAEHKSEHLSHAQAA